MTTAPPTDYTSLLHDWCQPDPLNRPTLWHCRNGCLCAHGPIQGLPPSAYCPNKVEALRQDRDELRAEAHELRLDVERCARDENASTREASALRQTIRDLAIALLMDAEATPQEVLTRTRLVMADRMQAEAAAMRERADGRNYAREAKVTPDKWQSCWTRDGKEPAGHTATPDGYESIGPWEPYAGTEEQDGWRRPLRARAAMKGPK